MLPGRRERLFAVGGLQQLIALRLRAASRRMSRLVSLSSTIENARGIVHA